MKERPELTPKNSMRLRCRLHVASVEAMAHRRGSGHGRSAEEAWLGAADLSTGPSSSDSAVTFSFLMQRMKAADHSRFGIP